MKDIKEEPEQKQVCGIKKILKNSKEFIKDHKEVIIVGILCTGFGAGSMYLYKTNQIKNINHQFINLKKEYSKYRILNELRHLKKDELFKEVISDGTRHGSPICAWHLRDLGLLKQGK